MSTLTVGASDKQVAFATRLLTEIHGTEQVQSQLDLALLLGHLRSTKTASTWIDSLLAEKRVARVAQPAREYVGPGYYAHDDVIFKVVPSRANPDRNYATRLAEPGVRKGRWVYEQGAIAVLTEADRLSLDDARAFGRTHGFCIVCGALLTDPKSVEQGIGPVCSQRF